MVSGWKRREIAFGIWSLLGLTALVSVSRLLNGTFPVFTAFWILIPMLVVAKTKDASRIGFRAIPWRELLLVSAINLAGLFVIMLLIEPWSHTYQKLLEAALSQPQPDTTFVWLLRYPRVPALGGMLLYSGLVTLFGEELFFRGWLLQLLQKRWGALRAIFLQALLFTIPNLLVTFALPPPNGLIYALIYSWLGIGIIGGWAASRTGSIWPSLISATLCNFILVALVA